MLPSERELMKLFALGRTSIREALYVLHRQGLVHLSTGERPKVTTPTPETLITELAGAARYFLAPPGGLEHFPDARLMFEMGIARSAALRCTDEDVARLRRALDANAAARGDAESFERTDVAFHYVLATITRNPIYTAVHDGLVEWLTKQRTVSLRAAGAEAAAVEGQRRVFEGVARRDPERAAHAMEEHLTQVNTLYRRVVQEGAGSRNSA